MAKRKGKNSLIDSIAAQAAVKQEPTELSAISSSNEQLESKTEYESLVSDIENNAEFDLQDSKYYVQEDQNAKVPEPLPFAPVNDTAIAELSSANLKLQSENAALQEENDKYLMKISELTFENAKLNAQVQELSKNASSYVPPQLNERTIPNSFDNASKKPAHKSPRSVNYPHQSNMGYASWN